MRYLFLLKMKALKSPHVSKLDDIWPLKVLLWSNSKGYFLNFLYCCCQYSISRLLCPFSWHFDCFSSYLTWYANFLKPLIEKWEGIVKKTYAASVSHLSVWSSAYLTCARLLRRGLSKKIERIEKLVWICILCCSVFQRRDGGEAYYKLSVTFGNPGIICL